MIPFAWVLSPIPTNKALPLLYLAVGLQIAALRPIPWRKGHQSAVDSLLIATGLTVPGAGVALVAWLAVFDGRVPGKSITWWAFLFTRAMVATAYVIPSIFVASFGPGMEWVPVKCVVFVVLGLRYHFMMTIL